MPATATPRLSSSLAALATCLSLAVASLAPISAHAAPEGSSTAEAESIFRRGQAKYETADYNGAIELWTEAYALIDSTPENASIKALLIYNLAQAHAKAFELDADAIHLKQAQQLLTSFRNNLELLYDDEQQLADEQSKVDEKLAEIEAMLAKAEAAAAKPDPQPQPQPQPEPGPEPEPEPPPASGPSGKPLIISGAAVLGLGVVLGAVGIAGAVIGSGANDISDLEPTDFTGREDRFALGATGNLLGVIGAIGAGVLLPTGAALIGIGVKRNKARAGALGRVEMPRLGASFGGHYGMGGGLTIKGRF